MHDFFLIDVWSSAHNFSTIELLALEWEGNIEYRQTLLKVSMEADYLMISSPRKRKINLG